MYEIQQNQNDRKQTAPVADELVNVSCVGHMHQRVGWRPCNGLHYIIEDQDRGSYHQTSQYLRECKWPQDRITAHLQHLIERYYEIRYSAGE